MSKRELALHVETLGPDAGPEVPSFVFIHGYGANRFAWRHWAPTLARRGHVVLVDLKGFGAAPKPRDNQYRPKDQADLVVQLVRERGLEHLTLIGHSLGGAISLLTAMALRDMGLDSPTRMVIVAGAAYEQRLPPFVRLAARPRLSSTLMRLVGPRRVMRHVLRSIVHDPAIVTESVVDGYAEPLGTREAIHGLIAGARQIVPENLAEVEARYSQLDVPTLLMWGRQDRVVPLWVGQRLAEDLPRARLHILESCGHVPFEEAPAESLAAVQAFLDDHSV